ncbi:HEAT repeat domain-containing protein, partial [Neisseria sp. WLZKY-1]|uniref:HEAT repeat domain-containing protein n=1 Tax=Neisseria sp. WLZKY-1 TaxID=3390377 RepID=UPI00397CB524
MSLLDKLVSFFKEGSNAASTLDYLHQAFAPLEKFDSNYPDRAVEYVMSGNEATLLMELNGKPDGEGSYLLGRPARFLKYFYYDDNKQARQAHIARSHLYADLFGRLTNEQIVRFGKLLHAATKGDGFIHTAPLAPVWFLYLMIDCYVLPERGANLPEDKKHRWTADQLLDLLRSEGVEQPEKVLIQTLFEREGVSKYDWGNGNDLFRKPEGIFEFLQAHPVELYEMVIAMSEGGQWVFIEKFGKDNAEILNSQPKLVVALCASGSKQVRKAAEETAGSLKAEEAREHLAALLANGTPKQRSVAADLLARGGEGSRSTLAAALDTEKSKPVRESIQAALNRLDSMAEADDTEYAPWPFEPLVQTDIPDSILPVLEQNARELTEKKRQAAEREIEENKTADYKSYWAQNEYRQWRKHYNDKVPAELLRWINTHTYNTTKGGGYTFLREILTYKKTVQNLPEYGLHHALRLESSRDRIDFNDLFSNCLQARHFEHLDLRQLAQAAVDIGVIREKAERDIAEAYLEDLYYANSLPEFVSRPELVIPFFMEHSDFIDEALGMIPSRSENELCKLQADKAIALLAKFPAIPKAYIPKLLEIALGNGKTARQDAQNLLQ